MAPAYLNVNSGQVVVSDEPRPDLEAQARWDEIPVPEPVEPTPPATPPAVPVAPPVESDGTDADPAAGNSGEPERSDEEVDGSENAVDGNSDEDDQSESNNDDESADSTAAPTPDETWTDEALDALGKDLGITWRSNASKATKVAKLTAPAAE